MKDCFFEKFCNNIEIDNCIKNKILLTKKEITNCVSEYYNYDETKRKSEFIGSYGRFTAVYVENIRVLVAIPSNIYTQMTLDIDEILLSLKNALNEKFITCEYSDNGNGLNINIDGNLSFEIVPGFAFDDGSYIFLNNREWKTLRLKDEKTRFLMKNKETGGDLIHLCRMLKVWKAYMEIDIGNILLDTFAYHFFNFGTNKEYSFARYGEMLYDFFEFMLKNSENDNFISIDGKSILKRKIHLKDKVRQSLITTGTALEFSKYDMNDEVNQWGKLFGTCYLI